MKDGYTLRELINGAFAAQLSRYMADMFLQAKEGSTRTPERWSPSPVGTSVPRITSAHVQHYSCATLVANTTKSQPGQRERRPPNSSLRDLITVRMSGATSTRNTKGKEINEFTLSKPRESDKRKAEEKRRLQAEMHGNNPSFPAHGPKGKKSRVKQSTSDSIIY